MLADEVFDWLSGLPDWQRDLARRVADQVEPSDEDYGAALAFVRHSFGLSEEDMPDPQPLTRDNIAVGADGDDIRLLSVGALQGVGLASEQEKLTFGELGLTVVYGQNGAGKSTYVRALKKLCRAVDRDSEVRGSIYEDVVPAPRATVTVQTNGAAVETSTSLDSATAVRIAGMSVFDSACAELYVDSQNAVQYIPSELRLLARLATLQDRLRHSLDLERQALQRQRPVLVDYPSDTAVGQALRTLSGHGSDEKLDELAALGADELERLAELRRVLATAQTSTARADADAAEREAGEAEELAARIEVVSRLGGHDALDGLRLAVQADRDARQAVALASQDLHGPIPGVGGGPWQVMWNAARQFVEWGEGQFPMPAGGVCPLCYEVVSPETAQRLQHFQEHVRGTVHATAAAHAQTLAERMREVSPDHVDSIAGEPLLANLREREPGLIEAVDQVLNALRADLVTIATHPETASESAVDASAAVVALKEWGAARELHATTLREADDIEALPGLKKELAELEARQRLSDSLQTFRDWQATLRVLERLDAGHTALATNKVTAAQRSMIEEGLAKALDAALTVEFQQLSCSLPVTMTTQIAKAETSIGLRLLANDPPRVSEIASEGERRALALCFFLAELEVANDRGGIVLDDPISSLDDERRLYVASRLVTEAASRQVIVFTHDLPFVFELRSLAKKAGVDVHVQHVWRQGADVGRVDQQPPFKTMDLRARVHALGQEIEQMRKTRPADSEQAWRQVDGFFKRVRTSWERAVEERLFGGVVERFERDVKTLQLRNVRVSPELIKSVDDGMTAASRYVHEDAFAAQVPLPSIDVMLESVNALRTFEQATRPTS